MRPHGHESSRFRRNTGARIVLATNGQQHEWTRPAGFPEIRSRMPMNCRATGRHVPLDPVLEKELARVERFRSQYRQTCSGGGPWLFGEFSIVDCMFAPVATRFNTYGVELSKTSMHYMRFVLNNEKLRQWVEQARAEPETIEPAEVEM
jgi:glutathione S-transferase